MHRERERQINLRTETINASLTRTLSSVRLTRYLSEAKDDLNEALMLYERNTRLSEAFYTPLQCLEICFRNTLDMNMTNAYGVDWFQNGNAPLNNDARRVIEDAYLENKKADPVPAGDIIAELKFSFWVSLLGPGYDSTLWRKALHKGFQVGAGKKRSDVHGRLNLIRRFRNRVAHHEPIFQKDLEKFHSEIIEAIGWMCRDTKAWTEHQSRVLQVLAES
jgi:Abi-like protein